MRTQPPAALDDLGRRDLHLHTPLCNHAAGGMEEYVSAGIEAGLVEVGFLEHLELGVTAERRTWMALEDFPIYWAEGRRLRQLYRGRIEVGVGLEVGINPDQVEQLLEIVHGRPWDHIGLSCHMIPHRGRVINIASRSCVQALEDADHREITLTYYRLLRDHLPAFRPDFVCHLDLPRKFMTDWADDPEVAAAALEVLDRMAAVGSALEINTSGYRWLGAPYPAAGIVRAARSRGVPLVLNSDSHHPDRVGADFDRALDYVRAALSGD
jgi:histidinol-phosphatase (PHP family)